MTNVIDRLFDAAIQADRELRTRAEIEAVLADPDIEPRSQAHDWRNHLPDGVSAVWPELSLEAKLVAFAHAARDAHAEVWD